MSDNSSAELPAMAFCDEGRWHQIIATCKGCSDREPLTEQAETWARMMQQRIATGVSVADAAKATESDALPGSSGHSMTFVVGVLTVCWAHGQELRQWWNSQFGIGPDQEGLVSGSTAVVYR